MHGTAQISTELANYKEELESWKLNKIIEENNFIEDTLSAGKNNLSYNGIQKEGNIKTIIPDMKDEYIDELEIIKGELVLNTTNKTKIKAAKVAKITANPYKIIDGELMSAGENLDIISSDGFLTIPENVTKIGDGAFSGVEGLKTVIIPGTVKEIGANAFAYNKTLEKVIMQDGVESIGIHAFDNAINLKDVNFPNSLKEIGIMAFKKTNMQKIEIPGNVKIIKPFCFFDCASLNQIILNEGTQKLDTNCFGNTIITKINMPSTITNIEGTAFYGCNKLENIDVSKNTNFIYTNGFLMTNNKEKIVFVTDKYLKENTTLEIPEGVKNFAFSFSSYTNIKKIIIPSTLNTINNSNIFPISITEIEVNTNNTTFYVENNMLIDNNKKLILCFSKDSIINVPEGIGEIGESAFKAAMNVQEIYFPESTTTIGVSVFSENTKLKKVSIGSNTSSINSIFNSTSVWDFELVINPNNQYYTAEDGILYTKNKETLVRVYKTATNDLKIDKNVKAIGYRAFYGQKSITEYKVPEGVETISYSFTYCPKLKKIEIPSTVKSIADNCFSDATSSLEEIIIHKKENSIYGAPWGALKGLKVVKWVD